MKPRIRDEEPAEDAVRPPEGEPAEREPSPEFDFERAFLWFWVVALVIVCLIGIIRALEAVR